MNELAARERSSPRHRAQMRTHLAILPWQFVVGDPTMIR